MKAVTFQGKKDIQVKQVNDPMLKKKDDIIIRVTSTSICGSDLHIYQGVMPTERGYVIGHEPMGIVEEVGPEVTLVKKGDRVVIPSTVSCGQCYYCQHDLESMCDVTNDKGIVDGGGYLGLARRYGEYPGGQAEYLHVPYGNFMPFVIPESCELEDEALLLLSDVLPTAYWSVEHAGVKPGDTVAVLGSGPIGLMTQKFAWMMGASRVIAIDRVPYRLAKAKSMNQAEVYNFEDYDDMGMYIREITKGGVDIVIDCVGMDGKKSMIENIGQKLMIQSGTMSAIRMAIKAVRKGGTIMLAGVYGGVYNLFPLGNLYERNITLKMGLTPVIHYMPELYNLINSGQIDPTEIVTHRMPLERAGEAYEMFNNREEGCIKVILKP
ncbi:zinc-dependent alcohol dehydrogenase [Paenibacillus sp. 7541]|uniref:zinc-dependent alcohol dehydrogenase n=1 Tax=Paenibacillus sp. 7541 TaxID=2026236 RepID=UPI000BA517A9|nr:zinc-dependent alcohol dehydrogenase [Paenibacillus sp. 7541]PAK54303.1 glutathione-dependent formaldehyde dehydrogenase [Paenibacillus sp. 7541]